jgi:hypothetical protein
MHTGGVRWGGGGWVNIVPPPRQIFEKLVNKNAIKPKIGGPPQAIFPESLDPPRDFGKKHQVPPPLDFQPVRFYELNQCATTTLGTQKSGCCSKMAIIQSTGGR